MPASTYSASFVNSPTLNKPSKLFGLGSQAKAHITIELFGNNMTYSTMDRIPGKVTISVSHNTRFESISIQLHGTSQTWLEKLQTTPGMTASQTAFHNFLRLTQPISESMYPQPRILEAGRTYTFPFLFVVPQHLLPRVCRHAVQHESVRELHLQLPPSLGSQGEIDGYAAGLDDYAPMMANISYKIVACIEGEDKAKLASQCRLIKILPKSEEQPPVIVDETDGEHRLRREKSIKKGLFKGRLGSLVAEANQPRSLRLPHNYAQTHGPVSTAATIRLRFDPSDANVLPPRLSNLNSRLKINTWYADAARPVVPNKKCIMNDLHQGLHSEMLNLSTRSMEGVEWKYQAGDNAPALSRRDSALSALSKSSSSGGGIPAPSERYRSGGFYTAEILVPVTLPSDKHLIPTFHSCLISRTYTLYLNISVQGGTITAPSVDLKLPIQILSEGSEASLRRESQISAVEEEEEMRSADEFFMPRTISPIADSLAGNSVIQGVAPVTTPSEIPSDLPPQYEFFGEVRKLKMIE